MKPKDKMKNAIRIRMYRIGFGDCFLVSFPTTEGMKHMLVDCGVHKRGDIRLREGQRDISLIEKAVQNIAIETKKELAVVIATHQHQDHIAGFVDEWFDGFKVSEVWMPWMDNPQDATAWKLKAKQAAMVVHLAAHFAAAPASAEAMAAVENLVANPRAIRLLQSGFSGGEAKYLSAGDVMSNAGGIKGLSVKVLAPSHDEKFLTKMDPPAGQRFLRMTAGGAEEANAVEPFAGKWVDSGSRAPALQCSAKVRKALEDAASESLDGLALALDKVRNNTSVVVSMSFRGQNLLFPGDAQYGNWSSWLEESGADEILGSVGFYKAAHHGSYNATPKVALEKMPEGAFAAMVSTQSEPWRSIPLPKLMKALDTRTSNQVARSDSIAVNAIKRPPMASGAARLARCFKGSPQELVKTI